MKYLVFDTVLSGHHLEYLHHIYEGALSRLEDEFIFLVPQTFQQVSGHLPWPPTPNVRFDYIADADILRLETGRLLKDAWHKSLYVRRYALKNGVQQIFLIMLMPLMPFLPLMLPKCVQVSGVLYRIYLYDKDRIRGIRLALEKIRYQILAHNRSVRAVYVLNDQRAAQQMNCLYRTQNFRYIPDPVPHIDALKLRDIRPEIGILPPPYKLLVYRSL
jgi:hypothetical protein